MTRIPRIYNKRKFECFVQSIKDTANSKQKIFQMSIQSLKGLFVKPCTVCGKNDTVKTNRNVALCIYEKGYVTRNVFPVCKLCHKIRHGLAKDQLIALAALTTIHCTLTEKCLGKTTASYKHMAQQTLDASSFAAVSTRAHSTNYNTYRCSAVKRCTVDQGRRCPSSIFTLTRQLFNEIRGNDCFYCGLDNASGIDRLYPALGYTVSNSVPCCKTCNYAKNDLHPAIYIAHMAHIVRNAHRATSINGKRAIDRTS